METLSGFKKILMGIGALALVVAFALVCVTGTGAAAKVNGESIPEKQITSYIQSYRSYAGYSDNSTWASFLKTYGYTASDLREQIINYYAQEDIVNQEAKKQGVSVTDSEISDEISTLRSQYGLTDDSEWQSALTSMGYTEQSYSSEIVKPGLLKQKLLDAAVPTPQLTDAELQAYVSAYGSYYSTDAWTAPTDGSTVDVTTIPSDVLAKIKSDAASYAWQQDCQTYLQSLYSSADIKINDMPKGLPYDVDTSNAQALTSAYGSSTGTSSSSTSSSSAQ